jgi:hypothetical protein
VADVPIATVQPISINKKVPLVDAKSKIFKTAERLAGFRVIDKI